MRDAWRKTRLLLVEKEPWCTSNGSDEDPSGGKMRSQIPSTAKELRNIRLAGPQGLVRYRRRLLAPATSSDPMRNFLAVAQGQNAKSAILRARSSSIHLPMRRMSVQCSAAATQAMLSHSVCLAPPITKSYRACFSHDPPRKNSRKPSCYSVAIL